MCILKIFFNVPEICGKWLTTVKIEGFVAVAVKCFQVTGYSFEGRKTAVRITL